MNFPEKILLISGKRKCGKDFISEKLRQTLTDDACCIVRISEPIKKHFALEKNLSLSDLMSDGPFKEKYRLEMINWSDAVRRKDSGYFCRAACKEAPLKKIWIVSDIRRKTDISWFLDSYSNHCKTIRIMADQSVRENRGWIFTEGVDDVTSECDLDDYDTWDLLLNNNNENELKAGFQNLIELSK